MFVKILLKYILGYVRISVEGYYIERFINICTTKQILLWDLKRENAITLHARVEVKNFKALRDICKKTKCKIKIESKNGLPFTIKKYKKRKFFRLSYIEISPSRKSSTTALALPFTSNFCIALEI